MDGWMDGWSRGVEYGNGAVVGLGWLGASVVGE